MFLSSSILITFLNEKKQVCAFFKVTNEESRYTFEFNFIIYFDLTKYVYSAVFIKLVVHQIYFTCIK